MVGDGLMNLCFYLSLARIPLGIAVTVEFLGPLAVAPAGSSRWLDVQPWFLLGVAETGTALIQPWFLLAGVGVALLSSVVPYTVDLEALRKVPPRVFGILLSLEPAMAALIGLVVLQE